MEPKNHKEKTIRNVSLINAGMNFLMAALKIIVGKIGYSQALVADGLHSLSDLVSDALVFLAARASIQHPDSEHPYGHRRIETIATILIGLILLAVAGTLLTDTLIELIRHTFSKPTLTVVVIAILSIIINEWLFHYSKRQGEKINSNLLISNAWHKRSDVYVSIIVLLSVAGSLIGWPWLDAIGAIIIVILIVKMAIQMIWQSTQELIDRGADEKTVQAIKKTAASIPGVKSIHQLRTRMHSNLIFVDLHVIVDPFISVSEGHHIGEEVHLKLLQTIKNVSDITVHVDPEDDEKARPSLQLPNREVLGKILDTKWSSLPGYSSIQKMTLHYLDGLLYIEIYMPQDLMKNANSDDLLAQYRAATQDMPEITSVMLYYI
jgi:cation diffusion facilitator family transporter